ncbi:Khsrp, partial [Symbiodinium sp. CCMP2456]
NVSGDRDTPRALTDRIVTIQGDPEQIEKACREVIRIVHRSQELDDSEHGVFVTVVPAGAVEHIIGPGGDTIEKLVESTSSEINISRHAIAGTELQPVSIAGTPKNMLIACMRVLGLVQELADQGGLTIDSSTWPPRRSPSVGQLRSVSRTVSRSSTPMRGRSVDGDVEEIPPEPTSDTAISSVLFVVSASAAAWIVGRSGRTVSEIRTKSGAAVEVARSRRARMSLLAVFALLVECLASPSDYWALASPSVRKARALQGLEAGKALALGGRVLTAENGTESLAPVWCGQEKYNGAAGKMWYTNPFTTACSRASTDLVYVDGNRVRVARRGDLIKMHCDNWECPIPPVVDCYFDRNACAADEWCMVTTHEKWGSWAMGIGGHTPNFGLCGESYYAEIEAIASQGDVENVTLEALKLTRDKICGSSTVGVANGVQLQNYSKHRVWKTSRGRCVKYRLEGQSCIPTLSSGRFRSAFVRRAQSQSGTSYPNGGTLERPLACAPGLVCTGPSFDVLPSTCVRERPPDVCYAGPWWDSSRCPRTSMQTPGMSTYWALESLQTAFLIFPGEVASAMTCKYWTGPMGPLTAEVRKVTHNTFKALWPAHLAGECPTLDELYASMWRQTGIDLVALTPEECAAGEVSDGRIAEALALVGSWTHRPNLLWSLIHFAMHNQPSPMSRNAVAASIALASHLSENFWCNDCRGFFTVGLLSEVGLPPQSTDGEEHARYWNHGHNIASEHVASTRGGHPWISTLEEAQDADVMNPFYVPYETSVKMWHVEA